MSSRTVPIEIDPVTIKMSDGKERKFLLSAGGMNRVKQHFNITTMKEFWALDASAAPTILFEALLDKGDLTEESFLDLLPYNPAHIAKAVALLMGASFPDPPAAVAETPTTAESRPN